MTSPLDCRCSGDHSNATEVEFGFVVFVDLPATFVVVVVSVVVVVVVVVLVVVVVVFLLFSWLL